MIDVHGQGIGVVDYMPCQLNQVAHRHLPPL